MVIYAKTDGEAVYKYLQSLVTDEQIAEAPSYYDKKYGVGQFEKTLHDMGIEGGLDDLYSSKILDEKWFDDYVQESLVALAKIVLAVEEDKFNDECYVDLAHLLMVARLIDSHTLQSRLLEKIKREFHVEVYDEEHVDSISTNKTKKE